MTLNDEVSNHSGLSVVESLCEKTTTCLQNAEGFLLILLFTTVKIIVQSDICGASYVNSRKTENIIICIFFKFYFELTA